MSLFEVNSLNEEYKLFDEDPFLLDLDEDACLGEEGSDESDSLTGTLSPLHLQYRQMQQQQQLLLQQQHQQQQQQLLVHQSQSLLSRPSPRKRQHAAHHKDRLLPDQTEDLIPDAYLQVHDYCASSLTLADHSSPCARVTIKSEQADDAEDETCSEQQVGYEQTVLSFRSEEQVDCDEQEDDVDHDDDEDDDNDDEEDEERVHSGASRKSSSANSSPQSTLGTSRRKSTLDKSLSEEERRLLHKEGYTQFPENGILTKGEEKILRKIRRKIRNKKSAQCSRQRKKEYVEELEKKFSRCNSENLQLKKELVKLRRENSNLVLKIKHLVADGGSVDAAAAAAAAGNGDLSGQASFKTSFFVLCLSFLLIIFPFMAPESLDDASSMMTMPAEDPGRRLGRNLLALASNFSPYDAYGGGGDSPLLASAINSTTASEAFFSFSF